MSGTILPELHEPFVGRLPEHFLYESVLCAIPYRIKSINGQPIVPRSPYSSFTYSCQVIIPLLNAVHNDVSLSVVVALSFVRRVNNVHATFPDVPGDVRNRGGFPGTP